MSEPISDAELYQLMAGDNTQIKIASSSVGALTGPIRRLRRKQKNDPDVSALKSLSDWEIARRIQAYARRMGLNSDELDTDQRLLAAILMRQWDLMDFQDAQLEALRSIRGMVLFFTILVVLSLMAGVLSFITGLFALL